MPTTITREQFDLAKQLTDDKTDALISELEAQQREARRSLRRPPRPPRYTTEHLAEVPF